jgi:hypothetical protein
MNVLCSYKSKWRHKVLHHYVWTECKKLINLKTGKEIKKTINGGKAGYYINRNFVSIEKLKSEIELIQKEFCPF